MVYIEAWKSLLKFDHVAGTKGVCEKIKAPTYIHKGDLELYNSLPMQGQMFGFPLEAAPKVTKLFEEDEILSFGEYQLQVIHTPGHSPGSVSFKLLNGPEILLSGDTLFKQSVGRSDLWGGDSRQLVKSIKDRLFVYDGDTKVFPGHGPSTLIGEEKKSNPFLN